MLSISVEFSAQSSWASTATCASATN